MLISCIASLQFYILAEDQAARWRQNFQKARATAAQAIGVACRAQLFPLRVEQCKVYTMYVPVLHLNASSLPHLATLEQGKCSSVIGPSVFRSRESSKSWSSWAPTRPHGVNAPR